MYETKQKTTNTSTMIKGLSKYFSPSQKLPFAFDNFNENETECGMRNPSTRSNGDDLSCLTSSSTSSHEHNNIKYPILVDSDNNSSQFNSTYLPQLIDPREWQQQNVSRKRKERQDSTSSITQDRKLVRSNSEEYLPTIGYEVIRRVSSHDEIKNSTNDNENVLQPLLPQDQLELNVSNDCMANCRPPPYHDDGVSSKSGNNEVQEILREAYRRSETSPARSRTFDFSHKLRVSPNQDAGNIIEEASDRRSSERFCRARFVSRKLTNKKSTMPLVRQSNTIEGGEHNESAAYKYDISTMKSECRGFISKRQTDQNTSHLELAIVNNESEEYLDDISSSFSDHNETNNDYTVFMGESINKPSLSHQESLPWDNVHGDDEVPVRSQRFSDDKFDHVNSLMIMRNESFGIQHFVENDDIKSRDMLKMNQLPNSFTTPDEKLKQINKRLAALKKRIISFEENFELENGYRPPHSIKLNDRYIKNALAEIHKLRKEKQTIKADPMNGMGYNLSGGENKVQKMRDTIIEIEKRLQTKRIDDKRSSVLEEMTADELVQEKTAVQRALLHLESLYGRPNTREERDAARLLYNRYRIIKRLVNRSASISGLGINNPSELPTILEHEAMAFTVAAISLTPPPSDTEALFSVPSTVDSPTDPTTLMSSTDSTDTSSSINENVHEMSLDELAHNLEIIRDEKKKLRRTIKEFEEVFEEQNGRKMLKSDRIIIEDTYALYKQKKAKLRLLDALMRKQMTKKLK